MSADTLHFYGLHGTSAINARDIEKNGFQPRDTYVAVGDHQYSMSEKFGIHTASSYGDSEYGIISVSFPSLHEIFGLDGDYVLVPEEIVASGLLVVRNVLIKPVPEHMRGDTLAQRQNSFEPLGLPSLSDFINPGATGRFVIKTGKTPTPKTPD